MYKVVQELARNRDEILEDVKIAESIVADFGYSLHGIKDGIVFLEKEGSAYDDPQFKQLCQNLRKRGYVVADMPVTVNGFTARYTVIGGVSYKSGGVATIDNEDQRDLIAVIRRSDVQRTIIGIPFAFNSTYTSILQSIVEAWGMEPMTPVRGSVRAFLQELDLSGI